MNDNIKCGISERSDLPDLFVLAVTRDMAEHIANALRTSEYAHDSEYFEKCLEAYIREWKKSKDAD